MGHVALNHNSSEFITLSSTSNISDFYDDVLFNVYYGIRYIFTIIQKNANRCNAGS